MNNNGLITEVRVFSFDSIVRQQIISWNIKLSKNNIVKVQIYYINQLVLREREQKIIIYAF